MKKTILVLRVLGVIIGLWLLTNVGIGLFWAVIEFSRTLPSSSAASPGFVLPWIFGPILGVALMLILPWSRIRRAAVWWSLFVVLATCAAIWMWQLLSAYAAFRRPAVLFYVVFLLVQIGAILAVRLLQKQENSQTHRYA